eukprot:Awhi_evm1s8347
MKPFQLKQRLINAQRIVNTKCLDLDEDITIRIVNTKCLDLDEDITIVNQVSLGKSFWCQPWLARDWLNVDFGCGIRAEGVYVDPAMISSKNYFLILPCGERGLKVTMNCVSSYHA